MLSLTVVKQSTLRGGLTKIKKGVGIVKANIKYILFTPPMVTLTVLLTPIFIIGGLQYLFLLLLEKAKKRFYK